MHYSHANVDTVGVVSMRATALQSSQKLELGNKNGRID